MSFRYAEPMPVNDASECFFYHSVDLPFSGPIKGHWDLRGVEADYTGRVNFAGKRVLDIGAASGFISFWMERQGAEVVSFDLADGAEWDVVPHYLVRDQLKGIRAAQGATLAKLKRAYWLAHREYGSNAKAAYGNVYAIPKEIGPFDVVFVGMVVGHMQDVFETLYQAAAVCDHTMVVTSIFEKHEGPFARFAPQPADASNLRIKHWWGLNIEVVSQMLGVLGFQVAEVTSCRPAVVSPGFEQTSPECHAIVARRV